MRRPRAVPPLPRSRVASRPALLLAVVALGACSVATRNADWSLTGRAPSDVPPRFVRDTAAGAPAGSDPAALPERGCWARLADPRNEARLTLRQSGERLGDYGVTPAGRYGVGAEEWLRVHCTTGRAVGIVPAGDQGRGAP